MIPERAVRLARFPRDWRPDDLVGRRVLVVGLGRFGGGEGAVRFLAQRGAQVVVTDLHPAADFPTALLEELQGLGAQLVLGEHRLSDLETADFVVLSPAVPWSSAFVQAVARSRKPVESEITLLVRRLRGTFVGVTGTNGKSTTVTWLDQLLRALGRPARVGGNLGGSLLRFSDAELAEGLVVLELSSFQIEHLRDAGLPAPVAVLTNVTPDHLDRHGSFEEYARVKRWLLETAAAPVLGAGDPVARGIEREGASYFGVAEDDDGRPGCFLHGERACLRDLGGAETSLGIEGFSSTATHARRNLAGALEALRRAGIDVRDLSREDFGSLRALTHRVEELRQIDGVRFVDDGVSTSPPAVVAALRSFSGGVHLLVGGYDKGIDPTALLDEILARGVRSYWFGAVGPRLEAQLRARSGVQEHLGSCHERLEHAFEAARRAARPGEVVLLSPGFASYDQYRNFEERARGFRALVAALGAKDPRGAPGS